MGSNPTSTALSCNDALAYERCLPPGGVLVSLSGLIFRAYMRNAVRAGEASSAAVRRTPSWSRHFCPGLFAGGAGIAAGLGNRPAAEAATVVPATAVRAVLRRLVRL